MDEDREKEIKNLLSQFSFLNEDRNRDRKVEFELFDEALTHSSYAKECRDKKIECKDNERLEFLGDKVLSLFLAEMLYKNPDLDEEAMTKALQILSNKTLASVGRKISGFEKSIRLGGSESKKEKVEDSIVAGAVEAFAGAVYVTFGIERTRKFVRSLFKEEMGKYPI
ncbi:MAG: ribonuclease III domain-containing protein [Thermoplasmata archaeon]